MMNWTVDLAKNIEVVDTDSCLKSSPQFESLTEKHKTIRLDNLVDAKYMQKT